MYVIKLKPIFFAIHIVKIRVCSKNGTIFVYGTALIVSENDAIPK